MDAVVEDINHCLMCQKEEKTTPATNWCEECENYFCGECLILHDKVPLCRNHTVLKLMECQQNGSRVKRPFTCKEHDAKIKLFCKDCEKLLCSVCCSLRHRKCEDVVTIKDILPEVKGQLVKRQVSLAEKADLKKEETAKYKDEVDKVLMESTSIKTDITKTIQAAIDHLREKEVELLGKLDIQTDQQTVKIWSKIKTWQGEIQMFQQQSQFIQQALELEDEAQLFEMYLSSGSEDEAGKVRDDLTHVSALSFLYDFEKLTEGIRIMDFRSIENTNDLEEKPELDQTVDAKQDKDISCDMRDSVNLATSGTKLTLFAGLKNRLQSFYQKT